MTTRIRTLLGSILLLMATMASAQTVHATVPFSFVAGSLRHSAVFEKKTIPNDRFPPRSAHE